MTDTCTQLACHCLDEARIRPSTRALDHARLLLLDTLGCAVGARGHEAARQVAAMAAAEALPAEATGLGSGQPRSLRGAVLDSGAAIRALDFNDIYWGPGMGGHPSDLFATALAEAERLDASCGDLLRAVLVGYDIYINLLDQMAIDGHFDQVTATAPAAAAMAARLRGVDVGTCAQALAIALLGAPCLTALRRGHVSSVKAVAPAIGQLNGLQALQLAAAGITGPGPSLDGEHGISALFRDGGRLDALVPGERAEPRITDCTIKRFPCIGTAQAAVQAAIQVRAALPAGPGDVARVTLQVPDDDVARHQITAPYRDAPNRETADHSFFCLVAMALADGELGPAQFDARRWRDPDVAALIERIDARADLPGARQGRLSGAVSVRLRDGSERHATVEHAPGHARNPLDAAGVEAKFRECVRGHLADRQADALIELWRGGDTVPVRALLAPLRTGPG